MITSSKVARVSETIASQLKGRFILYAPNVHTGGGLVLLKALLGVIPPGPGIHLMLDARAREQITLPPGCNASWFYPRIGSRWEAEKDLRRHSTSNSLVLCFHGLPPLFAIDGTVVVFQQNRNLLGLIPLKFFLPRTAIRLGIERLISRLCRRRVDRYVVQTPSMARALQDWYGPEPADIRILPFALPTASLARSTEAHWDFVYVADGEAHKNHRGLIEAWVLLARQGLKPSLALTLSGCDTALASWVDEQKSTHGLQVCNLGHLPHTEVLALYSQARALVFPSQSESFGLPLIEARDAGLPILASELDFVRDVCEPVQSFDPGSPVSIARAVRRFLGQPEAPLRPAGAAEFLHALMQETQ
jgi:Glycosyltransferase